MKKATNINPKWGRGFIQYGDRPVNRMLRQPWWWGRSIGIGQDVDLDDEEIAKDIQQYLVRPSLWHIFRFWTCALIYFMTHHPSKWYVP